MHSDIIVVSGLPRSGTSLMMQMLDHGGIEVITDSIRAADTDNPRGYYEYEQVKKIKEDKAWLPDTRGKAFKMVSQLLYELPPSERYRIIFMQRDLDEMLRSQEKMLQRLNRPSASAADMKRYYTLHLEKLYGWLGQQPNMEILYVNYKDLVERPEEEIERVTALLGGKTNVARMLQAVDPSLYRNRKSAADPVS